MEFNYPYHFADQLFGIAGNRRRHRQWTVPINATVSQLIKLGKQPVQFQIGGRYYAEMPIAGADWGVRFAVTLLFPK